MNHSRRKLLRASGAMAAAGLAGWPWKDAFAEPPPEVSRIRISRAPSVCVSPQYVAADLLRGEGFTEVEYVSTGGAYVGGVPGAKAEGEGHYDIGMNFAGPLVIAIDGGTPIVLLAGVHVGCFELVATERVRRITDLKGKTVAVLARGSAPHILLSSIATSVGLDPNRDIRWDDRPVAEAKQMLAAGSIDAMLAFPPEAQELRAKGIGHVLLNTAVDRPWSQYFCCLVAANREFVRRNPVATKRALRAILKASDICASDPDRAVKAYVAQGFPGDSQYVTQAMRELPFGKWRDYNPEETVRFYALRLREAGMVESAPQKLIAQGTDLRMLGELRKELKT
jgi:NitT/TauT family transport system substrate-binding protein